MDGCKGEFIQSKFLCQRGFPSVKEVTPCFFPKSFLHNPFSLYKQKKAVTSLLPPLGKFINTFYFISCLIYGVLP